MIYIDDHIDDFNLQEALAAVSPQRREQALRYRHERDQRLSVAAYRLLQKALRDLGIEEPPLFSYDSSGKPQLQGHPEIHFSMSHCREAVACAVGENPIGIDIETLEHYSEDVAARVMNADEIRLIQASPHPAAAFTRLWTMKESLYKLTGDDRDGDIAHMLDDNSGFHFTVINHGNYICTVCEIEQT